MTDIFIIHIKDNIMIFKGFKFGMLLQLAVGPMCLLVFNTSAAHGFSVGMSLVFAITLIDFLFISLSSIELAHY